MQQQNSKACHLANFVKLIEKEALKEIDENEKLFFSLNVPCHIVNEKELDDPISEIQELGLDNIPSANPIIFSSQKEKSLSGMMNELFQKGQIDGTKLNLQNYEEEQEFMNNLEEKKYKIKFKKKQFDKIYSQMKDEVADVYQDNNVQNKLNSLKQAEQEYQEFISTNEDKYLRMANKNHFQAYKKNQKYKKDYLSINIFPSCYKDYFQPDYNKEYNHPGFKKIDYNSQKVQFQKFQKLNENEEKLSNFLNGYGLGLQYAQEQSLEESFESIEIKAEIKVIEFKREWLDPQVFNSKNLQIENEKIGSWSNGTQYNQEQNAKLPYIIEGAFIRQVLLILLT